MPQDFNKLKKAVQKQLDKMARHELFRTSVEKDTMWKTYLGAFPEGSNPLHKERTEHDCQCCKQFIRACGNVVHVVKNQVVSLWNIKVDDPAYQQVADAMARLVESYPIHTPFFRTDTQLGVDKNHSQNGDDDVVTYSHFFYKLPQQFVIRPDDIGPKVAHINSTRNVCLRGLSEITPGAVETVLELIEQNSLYRGEEHAEAVNAFAQLKRKFDKIKTNAKRENFAWANAMQKGARIRNSAIGTLLVALSEGEDLNAAVGAFEAMVAPTNYKRPKALITKAMIKKAQQKVEELGLTSALPRRHANINDITINNIIFADRSSRATMDVFDTLASEVPENPKKFGKVEKIGVDDFMANVLPKAEMVELQMEGRHESNLMSLIAPVNSDVGRLFKWGNNFSWAYNGDIADSMMRERVKAAGGSVAGVLRFSIQWNTGPDYNRNDFDAHCKEPDGHVIYYADMRSRKTGGVLDVDITNPKAGVPAVENITWPRVGPMMAGKYQFLVHNYAYRDGISGFQAEIEFDGEIHSFTYERELRMNEKVPVADVTLAPIGTFKITPRIDSTMSTKKIWGVNTNTFHPVRVIMNSPNHWDGEETGNRHWFFMLDGCLNPAKVRGFFNEFLKSELVGDRKVFEVLGSKMKAEVGDEQLSGLGFSSTKRNNVLVRVAGSCSRVLQVNF